MDGEEPLSERVQESVKPHPDDEHEVPEQPETPVETDPAQKDIRVAEPQHAQKIKFDTYQGTLTKMETHHSGLWEFDYDLDKEIHFKAGQYMSVFLDGKKPAPFSIASSPSNKNSLILGVEVVGEVTTAMSQMSPGNVVQLKGPFGNFVIDDHERKVCFLAGGIGITPFMSMLRWIRDEHPDKYAVLFYSCKTKDQFMWLEELEAMQRENDNIKIVVTLTREQPMGWEHSLGRISETMIREEIPDFDEYTFFSCGPVGLIDAMFGMLEGMGVQKERMKREAWH